MVNRNHQTKSVDGSLQPLGYEQLTSLATAQSLTVPAAATLAIIQAETKDVRWRDDGTAPTSTVGMLLEAGKDVPYIGELSALQLIEVEASAKVNVSYYVG